jgi:hypothetical protein
MNLSFQMKERFIPVYMNEEQHFLTLYHEQNFEQLVKETAALSNLSMIRYHLIGLLGMGAYAYVLKVMLAKLPMLTKAMPTFLKIHREILKEQRHLPEHETLLDAYDQLPYLNQESDELIHELRRLFARHPSQSSFDLLTTFQRALSNKDEPLLADLIPQVQAIHLYQSREAIKSLLQSDASQHIKGLLMLQLIDFKFDDVIAYKKGTQTLQFNPIDTVNPFLDGTLDEAREQLKTYIKDPSVLNVAQSLLSTYVVHMVPYAIDLEYYFLIALKHIAMEYLRMPSTLDEYSETEQTLIAKKRHHLETILKL